MAKSTRIKQTTGERVFDIINTILMVMVVIVCAYPIWYVLVNAFNDGQDAMRGGIYFWPRKFSTDNFVTVFKDGGVGQAFLITILKTLIGTPLTVLFTAMVAYPLSKPRLIGRKFYMGMGTVTMFFSGGLIPTFLLYKQLHLLDNFFVFIFPAMFSFFNVLIFCNFFGGIPAALEESAKIDGATDLRVFFSIILPLSKPVLATIALFAGVGQWNDYFSGVMYITSRPELEPVQTYLYRMVAEAASNQMQVTSEITTAQSTSTALKLATMVITTVPIVCIYPFLQKYFVKGMLVGAVKE